MDDHILQSLDLIYSPTTAHHLRVQTTTQLQLLVSTLPPSKLLQLGTGLFSNPDFSLHARQYGLTLLKQAVKEQRLEPAHLADLVTWIMQNMDACSITLKLLVSGLVFLLNACIQSDTSLFSTRYVPKLEQMLSTKNLQICAPYMEVLKLICQDCSDTDYQVSGMLG